MIAIPIEYEAGKVIFKEGTAPALKTSGILILEGKEDTPPEKKHFDVNALSFKRSRELLKSIKGNLSDVVIEERRSGR